MFGGGLRNSPERMRFNHQPQRRAKIIRAKLYERNLGKRFIPWKPACTPKRLASATANALYRSVQRDEALSIIYNIPIFLICQVVQQKSREFGFFGFFAAESQDLPSQRMNPFRIYTHAFLLLQFDQIRVKKQKIRQATVRRENSQLKKAMRTNSCSACHRTRDFVIDGFLHNVHE